MIIMHFQTRLYLLKKVDGSIYHKVFEFAMCFGTIASLHFVTGHPDPVQQDRILTLETGLNFLHRFIIFFRSNNNTHNTERATHDHSTADTLLL